MDSLHGTRGRISAFGLLRSVMLELNFCACLRYAEPTTIANKLSSRRTEPDKHTTQKPDRKGRVLAWYIIINEVRTMLINGWVNF